MPLDSKSVSCSVCSADQEVSVIPHADFGTAEVESSNIAQHAVLCPKHPTGLGALLSTVFFKPGLQRKCISDRVAILIIVKVDVDRAEPRPPPINKFGP